jgi:hypothetical protein
MASNDRLPERDDHARVAVESEEKKASGPSLKLLSLVKHKGLDAIA